MIVPAIIPQSLRDLKESFAKLPNAQAVQVDVVDGRFVPFTSWPYCDGVRHFTLSSVPAHLAVEVDLMVCDALPAAQEWYAAGARRFVVHLESLPEAALHEFFSWKREADFELGLSCGNDVPVRELVAYEAEIDFVQLMGIAQIGTQGQPFDERVLARIEAVTREHPSLEVAIDGSVNRETLPLLKAAGASRFAVGSAIMRAADPAAALDAFTALESAL